MNLKHFLWRVWTLSCVSILIILHSVCITVMNIVCGPSFESHVQIVKQCAPCKVTTASEQFALHVLQLRNWTSAADSL